MVAFAKEVTNIGVIIYAKPFIKSFEGFKDGLEKFGYYEGENVKFLVKNIIW
jgi:hypothetical protein